ncbi:hypothetical protein P67b_00074 [Ruegeria phage Tedan]|nr:hypothetical protein P67b_00074 [Ruegeria phage Tedan]
MIKKTGKHSVELAHEMQQDSMRPLARGLAKMTSAGGAGQEGIILTDGSVLTAKETAAKSVAIQVKAQAEATHAPKKFKDLAIMDLAAIANGMNEGKPCSDAEVLRELMAMQNHEKYGGS